MIDQPALFGGPPEFSEELPVTRPTLPPAAEVLTDAASLLETGMLTNGRQVAQFEEECAAYLGVGHVVAVSSCTTGLMLVLRCLGLAGEVLLPAFTFCATAHAVAWNGLAPAFVDSEPDTFNLSARTLLRQDLRRPAAILAVHVFGNPCPMDELEQVAAEWGVPLVVDAAHAFGARYPGGAMVGTRGAAEVFSLSPTKVLAVGEGGLVATSDGRLAERVRLARNYANTPDYDSLFPGLSGRMEEFNALLGRANLTRVEQYLAARERLVALYRTELGEVPGLRFQAVPPGSRSTYKDLGVYVKPERFGLTRDELALFLARENVSTRKYFHPPLHRLSAYAGRPTAPGELETAEDLARNMLCLPLFSHLSAEAVSRVAGCVKSAHRRADEVRRVLRLGSGGNLP